MLARAAPTSREATGRRLQPAAAGSGSQCRDCARPSVIATNTGTDHTTYRLQINLGSAAQNVCESHTCFFRVSLSL